MYKLRKIKRKDLDLEKYSNALNDSLNYRIYAEYWYLDVLMDENWECWIYGDYEVIMPIPFQLKLGVKFVLQPTYCQQLGVFYKEEISKELFQQFEKKLHKKFVRSYCFNEENTETFHPKGQLKSNYVLDLNRPYETIKKQFSKSTKWNLKQFEKSEQKVESETNIARILDFKEKKSTLSFSKDKLENLMNVLAQKDKLHIYTLKAHENLEAYACFINSKNRVLYLNSTATQLGKKLGFPTGLLNHILEKYQNQSCLFDFEGSNIPALKSFFKGFGSQEKKYTLYKSKIFT